MSGNIIGTPQAGAAEIVLVALTRNRTMLEDGHMSDLTK
jgi:hypothetical protein